MARQHLFGTASRAMARAFIGLMLALSPACGSSSDEASDEGSEPSDSDRPSRPPARETSPPSNGSEAEPSATDDEPTSPAAEEAPGSADEAPAAPVASAGNAAALPQGAVAAFTSCTRSEGSYGTNCAYVHVSMTQSSPARCVQLTIDNCGDSYSRPGLGVDTPLSWQLSSASIGSSPDDCELGVYYPESEVVVGASGEISWDAVATSALPTGIVLDVTLQPSANADDTTNVEVVTPEPLNPGRCEG